MTISFDAHTCICLLPSSPFVACFVVHLSCEQVLGSLGSDVAIGLVDVDSGSEALGDFLGKADLLLGHQLVWQTLGL